MTARERFSSSPPSRWPRPAFSSGAVTVPHPIPAPPRRAARATPPATSSRANAFSVLFADPPRGVEEAGEIAAVDGDPVDEPEELASTPSADFIDGAVEAEAVAVAATERDDPDGEDLAPESAKGIG